MDHESSKMNEKTRGLIRNEQADFVRVMAMLFVIAIHLPMSFVNNRGIIVLTEAIFFTCNGIFYMLSGRFNLNFACGGNIKKSYVDWYIKKFINIFLPFICYTMIYYLYEIRNSYREMNFKGNLWGYVEKFLSSYVNTHFWFMYPLMGFIISAPFLAGMLRKYSGDEFRVLFWVGLIWEFFMVILLKNCLNIDGRYSGWILSGWGFYFVLGKIVEKIVTVDNRKYFLIIGLLSLILTVMQGVLFPARNSGIYDLSPLYTMVTIGMYVFLDQVCIIKWEKWKRSISYLAKHSFGIYALHPAVKDVICEHMLQADNAVKWMLVYILTLFVSLSLSIVFDNTIIKVCKSGVKKITNMIYPSEKIM